MMFHFTAEHSQFLRLKCCHRTMTAIAQPSHFNDAHIHYSIIISTTLLHSLLVCTIVFYMGSVSMHQYIHSIFTVYEPHSKAFSPTKEHLTILPKSGVGALSSVSAFKSSHLCQVYSNSTPFEYVKRSWWQIHSQVLTAQNTQHITVSNGVASRAQPPATNYIHLPKSNCSNLQ